MLPAGAATYSLVNDWSDTTNPNGVWSYLRAGAPFPATVANWSQFGTAWADSATPGFGFAPSLFKYDGPGTGNQSIDALAGDIVGHTQTNDANAGAGELAVRFTAPFAGLATISGSVWDAHTSVIRRQQWNVWVNGQSSSSGVVLGDGTNGRNARDTFLLSGLQLEQGALVELRLSRYIDNGGLLGMTFDVDLTPTSVVPVPASLPLFMAGIGGLLIGLRRR
ncbi:MAG: hypothetical protein WCJ87_13010 [Burkholderiales bacterium]